MLLNCGVDNSLFNFLNNINGKKSLKRKSYSDSQLNLKRARCSMPSGFPHQWGLYPGNSGDIEFEIDDDLKKFLQFKNILCAPNEFQIEGPSMNSHPKIDSDLENIERNLNVGDHSCSSEYGSIMQNIFSQKNDIFPGKKLKKPKKCKKCVDAEQFDKKAECTFQHNVNRKKLNVENMCYDQQKAMPLRKWTAMGLCEKFPYYYITHNRRKLSKNGFDNFYSFLEGLANNKQRINPQKAYRIWKSMKYDQKLPFLFEALLYKMSDSPNAPAEKDIRDFFQKQNRK